MFALLKDRIKSIRNKRTSLSNQPYCQSTAIFHVKITELKLCVQDGMYLCRNKIRNWNALFSTLSSQHKLPHAGYSTSNSIQPKVKREKFLLLEADILK